MKKPRFVTLVAYSTGLHGEYPCIGGSALYLDPEEIAGIRRIHTLDEEKASLITLRSGENYSVESTPHEIMKWITQQYEKWSHE